jgi:hypothetical protein
MPSCCHCLRFAAKSISNEGAPDGLLPTLKRQSGLGGEIVNLLSVSLAAILSAMDFLARHPVAAYGIGAAVLLLVVWPLFQKVVHK